jgi:hypothetical protein
MKGIWTILLIGLFIGLAIIPAQGIVVQNNEKQQVEHDKVLTGTHCFKLWIRDKAGRPVEGVKVKFYRDIWFGIFNIIYEYVGSKETDSNGEVTSDYWYSADDSDYAKIEGIWQGKTVFLWEDISVYFAAQDPSVGPDGVIELSPVYIKSKSLIIDHFPLMNKQPRLQRLISILKL